MWFLSQILGKIRSNIVKEVKKQALSISFLYFTSEYLFKKKSSGCKKHEWKFKANIARNATFKRHYGQIFARFGSKMAKTNYLQEFHFSQL